MKVLVSPAEPERIKTLGIVSSIPEKYGADMLWSLADGRFFGVQRKEIKDLIASARDGRIEKEIGQLQQCSYRALIIEGQPRWDFDGQLVDPYVTWNVRAHRGTMMSLMNKGIWVVESTGIADTCQWVDLMVGWSGKPKHRGLEQRPGPTPPVWGNVGSREWGIHFLQGISGIGADIAGKIYDHFGGVPMMWTVTREELLEVDGVGPKRADGLIAALEKNVT